MIHQMSNNIIQSSHLLQCVLVVDSRLTSRINSFFCTLEASAACVVEWAEILLRCH